MATDIDEARARLPLPDLARRLGLPWPKDDAAAKSCRSPLRQDDAHPSFSAWRSSDGRWRWKDHATGQGGDEVAFLSVARNLSNTDAFRAYLGMAGVGVGTTRSDDSPRSGGPAPAAKSTIARLYNYHGADGALLHQTVRFAPKRFSQRRPASRGQTGPGGKTANYCPITEAWWIWSLIGIETVLYRLPEIFAADPAEPIIIVEGEKDADALAGEGLLATTCPMGAAKWRPSYTETLRGRHCRILYDLEPDKPLPSGGLANPGKAHMRLLCAHLRTAAASLGVIHLADAVPWAARRLADGLKTDIADILADPSTSIPDLLDT